MSRRVASCDVMCCVDEEKKSCWVGMGSYLWKLRSWGGGRCSLARKARSLQPGNRGNRGPGAARRCQFPASFPIGRTVDAVDLAGQLQGPAVTCTSPQMLVLFQLKLPASSLWRSCQLNFQRQASSPALGMTHDATDSRGHKACWSSPLLGVVAYLQGVVVVYLQ